MTGAELAALSGQRNVLVIRRPFAEWLGHVSDALLFDQMMYWQDQEGAGKAWTMTEDEMADHLCMGVRALAASRKRLESAGFLVVTRLGIPARLHYVFHSDKAAEAFGEHVKANGAASSAKQRHWRRSRAEHSISKTLEDKDVWHPEAGAHNMPGQTATAADPPQLTKPERKARQTKKTEPGMLDAIRAMIDAMEAARGYPVANYARHTRAAKRLVKMDHTPDDVRRTVNYIKRECKHLDGQPVTMETVSKYIGIAAAKPKGRVIPLEELDWLELV